MISAEDFQNETLPIFLATTDIEATWVKNRPIIFLGTWCLKYSRREFWQSLNYLIFPYHWENRQKLSQDYLYISKVYEKVLMEVTRELNKIHRVNYSLRYWRITVGYWLMYFIQIYFDRWQTLQLVSKNFNNLSMYRVSQSSSLKPALDTEDFIRQTQESSWNEFIYAEIAEKHTNINVINRNDDSYKVNLEKLTNLNPSDDLIRKKTKYKNLRLILDFLGQRQIFRGMSVAIHLQYLKKFEYFKLSILMRQIPMRNLKNSTLIFEPNQSQRKWNLIFDYGDTFTEAVSNEIPRFLPTCFLEGYSKLSEMAVSSNLMKNPKVIVTDSAFVVDETWKLWAAYNCDNGSKLVISQHGGHYGAGAWSSSESHEIAISDRFISWGWKRLDENKVYPAPSVRLLGNRMIKATNNELCIQVTASMERQSGLLHSFPVASQVEYYLNDQIKFALSLSNEIRQKLIVRLFPMDFNWEVEQRWNNEAPEVVKDLGNSDINLLIQSARIYVATYNATTFLESFIKGVPTVMFWNPLHWELNENATTYYNLLRDASILFDDPVSCANHINSIWGDVKNWWNSSLVQSTVNEFVNQFAYVGKRPIRELKKALVNWDN